MEACREHVPNPSPAGRPYEWGLAASPSGPHRRPRGACRPIGFTLIELLVVIAIIAILASILFPVFAAVRAKSRTTTCASNQRQVYMALMMYADDSDGVLPPAAVSQPTATAPPYAWNHFISWPELLLPYTRTRAVFLCPEVPRMRLAGDQPIWDAGPYGMNYLYAKSAEVDSARDPSRTVLLLDTTRRARIERPESQEDGHVLAAGPSEPIGWPHVSWRHRSRCNVVFLDGHGKGMTPAQLAESNPGTTDQRRWWEPQ